MTGVALITFILLAVTDPNVQVQLLVWIFVMRIMMIIASGRLLPDQRAPCAKAKYGNADEDEFRGAADLAGVADFDHFGGRDLRRCPTC